MKLGSLLNNKERVHTKLPANCVKYIENEFFYPKLKEQTMSPNEDKKHNFQMEENGSRQIIHTYKSYTYSYMSQLRKNISNIKYCLTHAIFCCPLNRTMG